MDIARGGALALLLGTGLSACATGPGGDPTYAATLQGASRAVEAQLEAPFERGALALVAAEGPEIRTWRLVPCRGGTVCAWDAQGPAGTLRATPDFVVVDGLYGRRFWLSPGGDGYVQTGPVLTPLAWNSVVDGTGDGFSASLESTASHL